MFSTIKCLVLNPKKLKPLIKKFCDANDVDQKTAEIIIDAYWKRVKKALTEPEHISIYVHGFGTFFIKPNRLEKRIKMYQEIINKYQEIIDSGHRITMQKYAIMQDKKKALEKLEKMIPLLQEKATYKSEIKSQRNEHKRDLEKQNQDSRGDKKLSDQE